MRLFDVLWDGYRKRVPYVASYEKMIADAGGTFVNDHIALRTIAAQSPFVGIATLSRIFEAVGYEAAGCYQFPDKHLSSIHFQHANPRLPKLFISELRTWELPSKVRQILHRTLASHRPILSDRNLADWASAGSEGDVEKRVAKVASIFRRLPWDVPSKRDVLEVNQVTQFGAWVMLHGYAVNHFTALVNSHGVRSLDDIEKTVDALRAVGVPMKAEIEGERGSKLRQTATEAAVIPVRVRDRGGIITMPWTYAYFEIAERGEVVDPETGKRHRFEGFLGPQATQLFEMTRVRGSKT